MGPQSPVSFPLDGRPPMPTRAIIFGNMRTGLRPLGPVFFSATCDLPVDQAASLADWKNGRIAYYALSVFNFLLLSFFIFSCKPTATTRGGNSILLFLERRAVKTLQHKRPISGTNVITHILNTQIHGQHPTFVHAARIPAYTQGRSLLSIFSFVPLTFLLSHQFWWLFQIRWPPVENSWWCSCKKC